MAYNAERSVEDEIKRESGSDVATVLLSYIVMFAYVSVALGQFTTFSRLIIDSKITVANHFSNENTEIESERDLWTKGVTETDIWNGLRYETNVR